MPLGWVCRDRGVHGKGDGTHSCESSCSPFCVLTHLTPTQEGQSPVVIEGNVSSRNKSSGMLSPTRESDRGLTLGRRQFRCRRGHSDAAHETRVGAGARSLRRFLSPTRNQENEISGPTRLEHRCAGKIMGEFSRGENTLVGGALKNGLG